MNYVGSNVQSSLSLLSSNLLIHPIRILTSLFLSIYLFLSNFSLDFFKLSSCFIITFKRRILLQHHPTETILVTVELKSYKIKAKLLCESPIFLPPTRMYSRRRIYQYNKTNFDLSFYISSNILKSMDTHKHGNREKRKLTVSFCLLVNNVD